AIPIVIAGVGDPVGTGYVASLERPGGNITGVSSGTIPRTRVLDLIKEIVPKMSRLAVLANPGGGFAARGLTAWQQLARAGGSEAQPFEVDKPERFEEPFAGMPRARADALVLGDEPLRSP